MPRSTRSKQTIGRREGPGDERRREIVTAAAELFHRQGYAATSTQDIADAVGMLKGSLYHYIRTKSDLLYAVIEAVHVEMDRNVVECQAHAGSVRDRIVTFIDGHLRVCIEHITAGQVYAHDLEALDPERRQAILDRRAAYERFFRDLLAAGQRTGDVRNDLDVRLMSTITLASLTSVARWYDPQRSTEAEQIAAAYHEVLLAGLLTDHGRDSSSPAR